MTSGDMTGSGRLPAGGIWERNHGLSWREALRRGEALRERLLGRGPLRTVHVTVAGGLDLVVALLATRPLSADVFLFGIDGSAGTSGEAPDAQLVPGTSPGELELASGTRETEAAGTAAQATQGHLVLLTSGTTGEPKAVRRSWESLGASRSWDGTGPERWGIGYAPHTYAGVVATCQALARATTIEFLRPADLSTAAWPDRPALTVAAGTPSFWRLASRGAETAREIDTVVVGGEPVDAALLSTLHAVIQPRRINQVFGTTELGSVLTCDDGLPGLPADRRRRRGRTGAAFDVIDGRLVVSPSPSAPYLPTGDVAEERDGRIHVLGRDGVVVNVGGTKVNPFRVIAVLQEHPSVLAARAYGAHSALLGSVVVADVVPRAGAALGTLVADLKRFAAQRLIPAERPRRIRVVSDLALAPSGKVAL